MWNRRRDDAWRTDDRRDDDERSSRKRSLADRLVGAEGGAAPEPPAHDTPDNKRKKTEPEARSWGRESPRDQRRGDRERDRRRRRAGNDS